MRLFLTSLANRDSMPRTTHALELLKVSMKIEEDLALEKIASLRDSIKSRFLSHEEAWR